LADGLALGEQQRVFAGQEAEEGTDRRKARISRSHTASAGGFQMVQKGQYQRFVEVLRSQLLDRLFPRIGRVAQEQLEGVAIGRNGIGGKTFLDGQIVAKKPFYRVGDRSLHAWPPRDLTRCR